MKFAYYPGCSLESTAWEFDRSTRALCAALGVELHDIPDWTCCGSTPAHSTNATLATALPALNLAKARDAGFTTVLTSCASCYARLRAANHTVSNSTEERQRAERVTGHPYGGEVEVIHILDLLFNRLGVKAIRPLVKRPLTGLRAVSYYGCLLSRPAEIVAYDDPEHPTGMDNLVEAVGATPIDWPYKTECCGASLSISNTAVVSRLSHKILTMARRAGAQCVVVACPLCHVNLDLRQSDASKAHGDIPPTPVFYITQLLGLALGLTPKEVGIEALTVNADSLLASLGAVAATGESS